MSFQPTLDSPDLTLSPAIQELKDVLDKKDNNVWKQYWYLISSKVKLSISASEFQHYIIELIGRENLHLHNAIIIELLKSSIQKQKRRISNVKLSHEKRIMVPDLRENVDSSKISTESEQTNILTYLISCSNRCSEFHSSNNQELITSLSQWYNQKKLVTNTPTISSERNRKSDFQVCHIFSHKDTRLTNILLSRQKIRHGSLLSRYSRPATILEGYYPSQKVLDKMKGKLKDHDKGNYLLDDIFTHIPHLINLSFQYPSPETPPREIILFPMVFLINPNNINSRLKSTLYNLGASLGKKSENTISLACNIFLMRILLLISKIPVRYDNNSNYIVNANVIMDILKQNPQFLGALYSVLPKFNMYTIIPPEMDKHEREQNDFYTCL